MCHLVLLWGKQPVLSLATGLKSSFRTAGWTRSQQPLLQSSILHLLNKHKQTPKGQQTTENLFIIRWWVFRQPAARQAKGSVYLFFCSNRTTLHLAWLVGGILRGHTLNKLQTDSPVNTSAKVFYKRYQAQTPASQQTCMHITWAEMQPNEVIACFSERLSARKWRSGVSSGVILREDNLHIQE